MGDNLSSLIAVSHYYKFCFSLGNLKSMKTKMWAKEKHTISTRAEVCGGAAFTGSRPLVGSAMCLLLFAAVKLKTLLFQ